MSTTRIRVVAGVLTRTDGCVLLAQRRADSHLGGMWEFPGGKCEPGELALAALRRELREELGIDIRTCLPLLSLPWDYGDKTIVLDTWRVHTWCGEPSGCEGQAVRWQRPDQVDSAVLAAADRAVLDALRALPA